MCFPSMWHFDKLKAQPRQGISNIYIYLCQLSVRVYWVREKNRLCYKVNRVIKISFSQEL